jgi:transposase
MPKQAKKKASVEPRADAAPVKRRSTPVASVAGAEARRESGRVERSPAKRRRSVDAFRTDLPGSTASSRSKLGPRTEVAEMPERIGKEEVADLKPSAFADGGPTRSKAQSKGPQERSAMRTVALDLGSKITLCEVKSGEVVKRATAAGLSDLVDVLGPNAPAAKVAFEACREAWHVHDQLQEWGHEPLMLDTTRVRQLGIGQHKRKTDRIDAETMARALEVGRIPLAHVLSPRRRELRLQLGVRRSLVATRAEYITTIRGLARAHGQHLPKCDAENFLEHLRRTPLDEPTRALTEPLAKMLEGLTPQIALVDKKLEQLCAEEPVIGQLSTVPGVGLIVAAAFVSVIDEAKRFGRAHEVESYVGLVPSEETSIHRKLGSITKHGNSYLRALLVQGAHSVFRLRADDPLKRWGEAVAQRRGKRIAVVAVARRLVGILWAMWRDGSIYDPTKLGYASAAGMSTHARELAAEAQQQRQAVAPTGNRRPSGRAAARKTSREVTMS